MQQGANKNFYRNLVRNVGVALVLLSSGVAFAANDGCDKAGNDYINAEIALCSTHAYNIGNVSNPDTETDKQLMKDVVALKTTVMTQQMYKQYEYLESMLRRFNTQLEKAVLLQKLNAAGASDGKSSSVSISNNYSRKTTDKYATLDGTRNCNRENGTLAVFQCIQNNIDIVLDKVSDAKIGDLRQQLEQDVNVALSYGQNYGITEKPSDCKSVNGNAQSITKCAYALRQKVTYAIDQYNQPQSQRQNNMGGGFGMK